MTTIKRPDLVQSVADALQFISYYHPVDYIPVTVAVDADGSSLHAIGPAEWSRRIVELKVPVNSA